MAAHVGYLALNHLSAWAGSAMGGYTIHRAEHWIFDETGLGYGDVLGAAATTVGYECDGCDFTYRDGLPYPTGVDRTPAGFEILGTAPAAHFTRTTATRPPAPHEPSEIEFIASRLFGSRSDEDVERIAHGHAVLGTYTSPSSGVVITSGSTDWAHHLVSRPMSEDALAGFEETQFTHDGVTKTVYRGGSGPGVVVIHELPGLTPNVAAFARTVIDAGFTVAAPVLAGVPGQAMSIPYVMTVMPKVCVSKEFTTWATNQTSPVIDWLRALARDLHESAGGPGVGAIGMCFSGGFALAMAVDDIMLAPVCSQPSLPFAVGKKRSRDLGLSPKDATRIRERSDLCVLAMRFTGDPLVPGARFEALRDLLGDRVIVIEIDSSKGNPHGIPRAAHSVVTEHFVDEPGHPTKDALERVLAFFRERLVSS